MKKSFKLGIRMKKSLCAITLFLALFSVVNVSALEPGEDTKSGVQTPPSYQILSKQYKGTVKKITKYITPNWSKASQYTLAKGQSTSYGIQFSGASSEFQNGVKATGSFSYSKTYTATVSTTIPANSSKYSKLTYQSDYKNYYTNLQKTLWTGQKTNMGWATVSEPTSNSYAIVIYQ